MGRGSQRLGKGGESAMVLPLGIFLRLLLFVCFINSVCLTNDNMVQGRLKMERRMIARLPVVLLAKDLKPSPPKRFLGLEIPDYVMGNDDGGRRPAVHTAEMVSLIKRMRANGK